jgi:hypothetical protein
MQKFPQTILESNQTDDRKFKFNLIPVRIKTAIIYTIPINIRGAQYLST